MIISPSEFSQPKEITKIIFGEPTLTFRLRRSELAVLDCTDQQINDWYDSNFVAFPLRISAAKNELTVSTWFLQKYQIFQEGRKQSTQLEIIKDIDQMNDDEVRYELNEYLETRVNNIFNYFGEALSIVKQSSVFAGIDDNVIILKNLLKFYMDVRKDENMQLDYFNSINIPKSVSDLMTDALIYTISDRLEMMDPGYELPKQSAVMSELPLKIGWLGSQKDFAELFITLQKRNFISFGSMTNPALTRHLASLFDFSASENKDSSDKGKNLYTYFKTSFDRDLKDNKYFFEEPRYRAKFKSILSNKRKGIEV